MSWLEVEGKEYRWVKIGPNAAIRTDKISFISWERMSSGYILYMLVDGSEQIWHSTFNDHANFVSAVGEIFGQEFAKALLLLSIPTLE